MSFMTTVILKNINQPYRVDIVDRKKGNYMKKNRVINEEAIKQDCYYTTDETGHGIYAIPINTNAIFCLPAEELKKLRKKHHTLAMELEKKYRDELSHKGSLECLNNSITLNLISEALTRHRLKDFADKTFYGVSDVFEE